MYFISMKHCTLVLLLLIIGAPALQAQVYPNSPVFRNYRPRTDGKDPRNDGVRRQINLFMLERDAANGDPLAQHELGVRYLTGMGVVADTIKSAEWLQQAAGQGLVPAMYNLGLLYNNGWGVEWNPFNAYTLFHHAAKAGMPEARYVVGIFHTDDLVLKQNWETAFEWIDQAHSAGYEPAARAREEIIRRGHVKLNKDSVLVREEDTPPPEHVSENRSQPDWVPVLLDMNRDTSRSAGIATSRLVAEYLATVPLSRKDSLSSSALLGDDADTTAFLRLQRRARFGNPEAVVLLGRMYEEGRLAHTDELTAAALYAAGVYLESAHAVPLLIQLLRESKLGDTLPGDAFNGNAQAQFVWALLRALEIDTRLVESQALDMLERAAAQKHVKAMVHLGVARSSGRWVKKDMDRAEDLWAQAAELRDEEARIRLAAAAVLGRGSRMTLSTAMPILEAAAGEGSILAEVALAYSYEHGVGRSANRGVAVRLYRSCAVRGSQTAYFNLRRMHEELRPDTEPFLRDDL